MDDNTRALRTDALVLAACLWVEEHGIPEGAYSSIGNRFLHAAEAAYFQVARPFDPADVRSGHGPA